MGAERQRVGGTGPGCWAGGRGSSGGPRLLKQWSGGLLVTGTAWSLLGCCCFFGKSVSWVCMWPGPASIWAAGVEQGLGRTRLRRCHRLCPAPRSLGLPGYAQCPEFQKSYRGDNPQLTRDCSDRAGKRGPRILHAWSPRTEVRMCHHLASLAAAAEGLGNVDALTPRVGGCSAGGSHTQTQACGCPEMTLFFTSESPSRILITFPGRVSGVSGDTAPEALTWAGGS